MNADFTPRVCLAIGLVAALTGVGADSRAFRDISARTTGGPFAYETVRGDSLASLAARYGINPRDIAEANGLKLDAPLRPGTILHLDNRHIVPVVESEVSLAINVPQRMLFLVDDGGLEGVPVALGRRDWPTPLGDFTVTAKEENPTWDVPVSIQEEMRREGRAVVQQVPPGPENPLGAFWLRLSLGAVGVHGTNAPSSIFRHVTHGCIRLHPDDIARLYPLVAVGSRGRILYEPVLLAQAAEGVFLEAHPDVYRRTKGDPFALLREDAAAGGISDQIDWSEAARVLYARRGTARLVSIVP